MSSGQTVTMESSLGSSLMPRTILRHDDAVRIPRAFRMDSHDRPRAASEDTRPKGSDSTPNQSGSLLDDSPPRDCESHTPQDEKPEAPLLSVEETTELFRSKIEDARQHRQNNLDGAPDVADGMKPNLTLDLGHSKIARLPETVVDLIREEVERLSLSHNQIWHIPLRFAECSQLRYLNIRQNVFREIPRGIYKLEKLEILDISRNRIRNINPEIKQLKHLKVFSIMHNKVEDLPTQLSEMSELQILKTQENPLRFKLKRVIEAKEAEVRTLKITDQEKEIAVTAEIKSHLRQVHSVKRRKRNDEAEFSDAGKDKRDELESGEETSDGGLDTPKPMKRLTSRFPVIPSLSSSEALSDMITKSPGPIQPPPIPVRSQFRDMSDKRIDPPRRPGVAPWVTGNERNRSNSESVLQASAAARTKRMGMLKKSSTDLKPLEESKTNRYSHLRGYSHGSALRTKSSLSSVHNSGSASSPRSPRDIRNQRHGFVRRLSSLPEHKKQTESPSAVIECARSVLYSFNQLNPEITGILSALNVKGGARNMLEMAFHTASLQVDRLNAGLDKAATAIADTDDEDANIDSAVATVEQDCAACIMAYTHVTSHLQSSVQRMVALVDARHLRTFMILLYGSMIEIRNAVVKFGIKIDTSPAQKLSMVPKNVLPAIQEQTPPQRIVQTVTPTRDRSYVLVRPAARLRSDTTIQHPTLESHPEHPPESILPDQKASIAPPQDLTHFTGSTLNNSFYNSSVLSMSNGNTFSSSTSTTAGLRSRANSRNATYGPLTGSSLASSYANTPRSGEAFNLPPPTSMSMRINPMTGLTDAQEEVIFEKIFLALTRAYDSALQAVPIARRQFARSLDYTDDNNSPKQIRELWRTLLMRCETCLETSEALKARLINMRLKDPANSMLGALSGRNDGTFWQLSKTFMQSFVELVTEMKHAKDLRLLPQEVIIVLRPVQKASREAGKLVETSPWGYLTEPGALATPLNGPYMNGFDGYTNNNINGYTNGTNGYGGHYPVLPVQQHYLPPTTYAHPPSIPAIATSQPPSTGASPVSASSTLPTTPLSAALGPAAQATVPSTPAGTTPASAHGDSLFSGNVFQRADALLSMPQAGNIPFVNRR